MGIRETLSLGRRDVAETARQTSDETREQAAPVTRPRRVPVDGRRDILTVEGKDKDYVYRWVNDVEDNVARHIKGWYEHVTHSVMVGDGESFGGGTASPVKKNVGGGITAYLMRIKKEYYDEDQAAFARRIRDSEADMFRQLNTHDAQKGTYGSVEVERR